MYIATQAKTKLKCEVELTLNDGTTLTGNFWLNAQERVLDVLNDNRAFLPFDDTGGGLTVVAKSSICRMRPIVERTQKQTDIPSHLKGIG